MPDILMCRNVDCEKKETCYRFKAKASGWQSYMKPDAEDCQHYWPIEEKTDEVKKCDT